MGKENNMNIFILDKNTAKNARYHCNSHVIKMPLELMQILSTVLLANGKDAPMVATHKKHPSVVWAGISKTNFIYTKKLCKELCKEFRYRYLKIHEVEQYIDSIEVPKSLPDLGLTEFAQAMPLQYKCTDAVHAYRLYYIHDKLSQYGWRWSYKFREKPDWALHKNIRRSLSE